MPTSLTASRQVGHDQRSTLGVDRRRHAVQAAITHIERRFGRGAIWHLDPDQPVGPIPVIPTGTLPLDRALGVGGLPRGRLTEIYGPESSGKTTLALSVIAQAQQGGGTALFVDAEHAPDLGWARTVGVDVDRLLVCQPDCGEHALTICETLIRSGALDVAVIDSAPALVPKAELDGEMGEPCTGVYGRLMAQAMRRLAGVIGKSSTVVVFCNQLREDPGKLFGNPEVVPGGRALKHHAAVRLDLRLRERLMDRGRVVGNRIHVKVIKSKVAVPFRTAGLDLLFDRGIDAESGLLDLALDHALITKTGGSYTCHGQQLGWGRQQAVAFLRDHPKLATGLDRQLRVGLMLGSQLGSVAQTA